MRRAEKLEMLRQVVAKRHPDLLPLAAAVGNLTLTDEQIEQLSDVVLEEFLAEGLGEDYEPNTRGVLLDEVMGFLTPEKCNP